MASRVQDWDANSHTMVSFTHKAREVQISLQERRFSRIEFVQMKMVSCHRGQFMLMVEVWNAWNGDPIMIGALCTTICVCVCICICIYIYANG